MIFCPARAGQWRISMEGIKALLGRSHDYWEAVRLDRPPTAEDERLAIEWQEINGCPVIHDDGVCKAWRDVTDNGNYVISTPHGLMRAARMANDEE